VNGDRCLDPTDAVQVINFLNDTGAEPAADEMASRVAPIWYDDSWTGDTVLDDTPVDETDSEATLDTVEADEPVDSQFAPYTMPRLKQDDESTDAGSDEEKVPADEVGDELFSAEVDWLADVI